jgi:hypothetical protein
LRSHYFGLRLRLVCRRSRSRRRSVSSWSWLRSHYFGLRLRLVCRRSRSRGRSVSNWSWLRSHYFGLRLRLVCSRSGHIVVLLRRCLLGLRVLLRREHLRLMLNRTRTFMGWTSRRHDTGVLLLLKVVDRGNDDVVVVNATINFILA